MTTDQLTTTEKIIAALDELQEIHGTEHLTYDIMHICNKRFVRVKVRMLEAAGEIIVERSRGGRGRKTIYRRNRNSPGSPRRSDKHKRQIP